MDPKMVERSFDGVVQYVKEGDAIPADRVVDDVAPIRCTYVVGATTVAAASTAEKSDCDPGLDRPRPEVKVTSDELGCNSSNGSSTGDEDPWSLPRFRDTNPKWSELTLGQKCYRVSIQWIGKLFALLVLLYFFVCSLDLLSSAFRLVGGKAAGAALSDSQLLRNPIAGLMIGVLATVLVQSSSTSTSIIVAMVASGILEVEPTIPIIMGANIGTSVTNTIVSLAQSPNRDEFRRAFAGATVHDMFNWLSVIVLLPTEAATGYMYRLTDIIVQSCDLDSGFTTGNQDLLQMLTKPLTERIVQLDKKVIEGIAKKDPKYEDKSLIKVWCHYSAVTVLFNVTDYSDFGDNKTLWIDTAELQNTTKMVGDGRCQFLFYGSKLGDGVVGAILLLVSLLLLCSCLVLMVKLLNSALRTSMMTMVKKVINYDLPGHLSYFTGYIAILVGAGMTIVVQSSSVFTSALTPLVGIGVIKIERMYPLTLGSNIGTTTTGILAAMAAADSQLRAALQIALCHLFFNLSGILLFYPIPVMRFPIRLAKVMGSTTARYRWFAIFYVAMMFFVLPFAVFGLSMAGSLVFSIVISIVALVVIFVLVINMMQRKVPGWLPSKLRTWDFLPYEWMHSLDPFDRVVSKLVVALRSSCCPCCNKSNAQNSDIKIRLNPIVDDTKPRGYLPVPSCASIASSACTDVTFLGENGSIYRVLPSCASIASSLRTEDGPTGPSMDIESGYTSVSSSPGHTPCVSRLPSYKTIQEAILEAENENGNDSSSECS